MTTLKNVAETWKEAVQERSSKVHRLYRGRWLLQVAPEQDEDSVARLSGSEKQVMQVARA